MLMIPKVQKAPVVERQQEEATPRDILRQQQIKKTSQEPDIDLLNNGMEGNIIGTMPINVIAKNSLRNAGAAITIQHPFDPKVFTLNEVDLPPVILRQVIPQYPSYAIKNKIEGKVVLRFIVDSNGNVVDPEVIESRPDGVFDNAATEAILKYRFKPAEKGGKSVDCIVTAPIAFRLR